MNKEDSNIVYAYESASDELVESIFLAGPSPRDETNYNWRPEAVTELRMRGFKGNIFVPLPRDGVWSREYDDQVEWELEYLNKATVIIFWIPRDLKTLPAFTTNVEFGMFLGSGRIVLGYPDEAPKMKYLDYVARKNRIDISSTLAETVASALRLLATLKK